MPPGRTQEALRRAFTRWGLPGRLRVDNGTPWGSKGDLPTDLALWLLGLGVGVAWNPPRRPQGNGSVESARGVGRRWAEPWACASAEQLQRQLGEMDRIQREEYPQARGLPRLALFPGLGHSGRAYRRAGERRRWSLAAVAEHLAGYAVPRRVDRKGMISIYNRNHYVGRARQGASVWVGFDPQALCWLVSDGRGNQLRTLAAPEICRARIVALEVTNRRDEQPGPGTQ